MYPPYSAEAVPNAGWDPRVRVFRSGRLVDSFAVVTDRYVVVVDTMCNPESASTILETLRPEIEGRDRSSGASRGVLVVNTHGDWDHVWGNCVFAGGVDASMPFPAPIIAHRLAAERMTSDEAVAFLASFKAENPGRVDSVELCPPTVLFDGSLRIDGGDLTLELMPTPGHTPDHVSIWVPEIRMLLTGDAAEVPIPFVPDPLELPALRASLHRLSAMDADTVLYCHAHGVIDGSVIRGNISYFDELERRCRRALSGGRIPETLANEGEGERLIDWPMEDAVGPRAAGRSSTQPSPVLDEETSAFYRVHHQAAIRAMLTWLRTARGGI